MKFSKVRFVGLTLLIGLLSLSCQNTQPSGPLPGLGGAAINTYMAVGNSLTAGYQSGALFASAQIYSYPNLIAQQIAIAGGATGSFQQPLYSDPGTPDPATGKAARLELLTWHDPRTGQPLIGPRGLAPGNPTNLALKTPYNNLGIPGAVLFDFLDTTNFGLKALPPRSNPLFLLILRDPKLGNSMFQQTANMKPDLVTFWLGNNDVLGFATSGGTSGTVSPPAPTPAPAFAQLYGLSIGALRAALPKAKIVVGTIPDVDGIPFFTTIGPKIALSLIAAGGYPLVYQSHSAPGVATIAASHLTEAHPPLITLTGSAAAAYIGHPTGFLYAGGPLPPGIDTTRPFGLDPANPWPDAFVLDSVEQAEVSQAVIAYNGTIRAVAAADNAVVVDFNAFFHSVKASGYRVSGQTFSADYISGPNGETSLFSFDGVHPNSQGQAVMANQFIGAMNSAYGMSIPLVDVARVPSLPVPLNKGGRVYPVIPPGAFDDLPMLWGAR